jgi:hypothetical protein
MVENQQKTLHFASTDNWAFHAAGTRHTCQIGHRSTRLFALYSVENILSFARIN